jgi:hypothetical protein
MFELSNIKITKSKIDDRSIESNGFWFTPTNDEFNVDGVVEFITSELESPKWLDGKTFSSLNHLFVTESQTNLFMALCPFVEVGGYQFELKYNRILGGHQLHVTKAETDEQTEDAVEESKEQVEIEEKTEDAKATEDTKEVEEKEEKVEEKVEDPKATEDKTEDPKEKKTTARKSTKK